MAGEHLERLVSSGKIDEAIARIKAGAGAEITKIPTGKDSDGLNRSALGTAIDRGLVEVVKVMLAHGADLNVDAAKFWGKPLQMAIREKNDVLIKLCLEHGADIKAAGGEMKRTPLHDACDENIHWLIEVLLERGADVNALDSRKYTPLHEATDVWTAEALLARGAKVDARMEDGRTPLMLRLGNQELARLLIARGASTDLVDDNGNTILHEAASTGFLSLVRETLAKGVKSTTNKYGWTALHDAATGGHVEVAKLLLASGFELDARSKTGETPLYVAARYAERPAFVELLLERGADISVTAEEGTLFDVLFKREPVPTYKLEMVKLIMARGGAPTAKQLQSMRRGEAKVAKQRAMVESFDWAPLETYLLDATIKAVKTFAKQHGDAVFYGFCFDCSAQEDGQVLFCLNTQAKLERYQKEHAGATDIEDWKWGPGNWEFQDFANLVEDRGWRSKVKPLGKEGIEREVADALLDAIARVAVRLVATDAFSTLRCTDDFSTFVIDHDETHDAAKERMARARIEVGAKPAKPGTPAKPGMPAKPSKAETKAAAKSAPAAAQTAGGKKRRFEFVGGGSSKFWEIEVTGSSHTVTFGKIGTPGQAKEKDFASAEAAAADAAKLVAEKTKKGYTET